jgi:hypothetical protein
MEADACRVGYELEWWHDLRQLKIWHVGLQKGKTMKKSIGDGGLAFPQPQIDNQGRVDSALSFGEGGMTLRDYFAAKAMQSDLSIHGLEGCDKLSIAEMAYEVADAMIEARLKI